MDTNSKNSYINHNNLLTLKDVNQDEIMDILKVADIFRFKRLALETSYELLNKKIIMVTKPNYLKTNITFSLAVKELSGEFISTSMSGDALENTLIDNEYIKALSSFGLSCFVVCTNKSSDAEVFKNNLNIPIINANSKYGPIDALATIYTIYNVYKRINGLKITLVGDFISDESSLLYGLTKLGADITLLTTKEYAPKEEVLEYTSQFGEIRITEDKSVIKTTDLLVICYANENFPITINEEDVENLKQDSKFICSLPYPKNVIKGNIFDSEKSLVSKQTENLLCIEKSCLSHFVGKNK